MGVSGRALRRVRTGLRVVAVVSVLLVIAGLGLELRLTHHLTRVPGVFDPLGDRPPEGPGTTLLLLGTVPGDASVGPSVPWLPADPGLESVMLVRLAPDRRSVLVESLEPGRRMVAEITAAEPHRAVAVVEKVSGRRVDHLVAVDWSMLQRLADDNGSEIRYRAGSSVAGQHRFLRRMLEDTLHTEMRKQPWTLDEALSTVTRGMAVEAEWSVLEMSLLLLSLRDLRSADIEFRRAHTHGG